MVARVPTVSRQIDAAAKGQLIVNHHDLLVMAGAYWMVIIESEADAACAPSHPPPRRACSADAKRAEESQIKMDGRCGRRFAMKAISASSRVGASAPALREVDGRKGYPNRG